MTQTQPDQDFSKELDAAINAAREAERVIMRFFNGVFEVSTKADDSPVTQADVQAEETIRDLLSKAFPEYGFYGEETGSEKLDAETLWLVDPIDGTKSFIRQSPFFSTQIALMHRGQIVMGVSNAPAMQAMATARKGGGAVVNGQRATVSEISTLTRSYVSTGNVKSVSSDPAGWARLGTVLNQAARVRGYGDFYHYHQLACGQADIVIESDVNILDIAALSVIVEEAGGHFTDMTGGAIGLETTSVLAACSESLHADLLARLGAST